MSDPRSALEIADSIRGLVARARADAAKPGRAPCPRCQGRGVWLDHPCRCEAGAAGRASLRADRARRDADRRLAKARGAARAASEIAVRAGLRALKREWDAGRRLRLARGGGIATVMRAQYALERAVRRAALVERDVRGSPAEVGRELRYAREVGRAREKASRMSGGPERLRAVLARALNLGTCPECDGGLVGPGAVVCPRCAARGARSSSSPSVPDRPAHEGRPGLLVEPPTPGPSSSST